MMRISSKGTGWTISLAATGAYVECFERDGKRFIEYNFYDGGPRDLEWTEEALEALSLARIWQETGKPLR